MVSEELHFGRAAKRLKMTQPPLSQQIAALERELGVRLFIRDRRHVELSPAGRVLIPEARRTVAQAGRLVRMAEMVSQGTAGDLRVGFIGSSMYGVVPTILNSFRALAPDVHLTLNESTTGELDEAIETGELDIAFVRPPVSRSAQALVVDREPLVVALPRHHRLATLPVVELSELREERFVMFERDLTPGFFDYISQMCLEAGFALKVSYEVSRMQAMVGFVAAGVGVALVPASVQALHLDGVQYRPISPTGRHFELVAAWMPTNDSPALIRFIEHVANTRRAISQLPTGLDGDVSNGE